MSSFGLILEQMSKDNCPIWSLWISVDEVVFEVDFYECQAQNPEKYWGLIRTLSRLHPLQEHQAGTRLAFSVA